VTRLSAAQGLAVLVLVAQVAVLAGAAVLTTPNPDLVLDLAGMADPMDTHRVTDLAVDVTNRGDDPLAPRFTVAGAALKNRMTWAIQDGPATLDPGESDRYHVTQPPYTGVPEGEPFRVLANDVRESQRRARTPVRTADVPGPRPAVANPGFQAWAESMVADHPLPYGWVPTKEMHGSDDVRVDGSAGRVDLALEPDVDREPTDAPDAWSMVGVRQRVDFPRTLEVAFEGGNRSAFAGGPSVMVGVVLEDGYARNQLVVLFTRQATDPDQADRRFLESDGYESERVLVTGREATVNVTELWRENGWRIPGLQWVDPQRPHGPANAGFGGTGVGASPTTGQFVRAVELKVVLASYPPHESPHLEASFGFVGGPVLGDGAEAGG
jgi:hypothetical protein